MVNMINQRLINQTRDGLVRDLTTIGYPMAKSEVRRTINSLLDLQLQMFKKLIIDEIVIAHTEGTPTARLTSLFNKL